MTVAMLQWLDAATDSDIDHDSDHQLFNESGFMKRQARLHAPPGRGALRAGGFMVGSRGATTLTPYPLKPVRIAS
jgi:hypothetical protein